MIDRKYRGELLSQILAMPEKNAISFNDAVRMAGQKYSESKVGNKPGESIWYFSHFVEWLSSIGLHIELTGDEFDGHATTDKAS